MIKILLLPVLGLLGFTGIAQQTIAVHFLYGSVPAPGYKNAESKWFGGK